MSVFIKNVEKKSLADKKHIQAGYELLSVNGYEIHDFLDYRFRTSEKKLELKLKNHKGKIITKKIKKAENDDLGLGFETYLMDKQRHCANKCIFCFIDQLPKGLRESLYFKDDDARLSFLFGNYITLTNLKQEDVDRIIEMRISPVNVSVHTMNPELRVKMMKNPNAGECLKYIRQFADAGIKLNAQLVLCPGYNDGAELIFSIEKLAELYPSIQSIAAVPVGLSKYRDGLCHLKAFDKQSASDVLKIIEAYGNRFAERFGTRLVFAADEFYLCAGQEMPPDHFYEDYPQIENGVGLWADMKAQFQAALNAQENGPEKDRCVTIATGVAAYPLLCELSQMAMKKFDKVQIYVKKIVNTFFGDKITVAGLITGKDLTEQLKDEAVNGEILISSSMLRKEGDMFLDSMTLEQAEKELNTEIIPVGNDGYALLQYLLFGKDAV